MSARFDGPPLRVLSLHLLSGRDGNPYIDLLHGALERRGAEVETLERFDAETVERAAAGADVVHLHWLEYLTASRGTALGRLARSHVRLARALRAIRRTRGLQLRVVWTVHNLRPHEQRLPWIDPILTREVLHSAGGLLVHSDYAAHRVIDVLHPRSPIWVAPHGSYLDAYPPSELSQAAARVRLGLPAAGRVFLCFGQIRGYKRIPEVVRAFRSLPDASLRLVVAGRPHSAVEEAEVMAAAAGDPRVHLALATVPADDVSVYHAAADVAVINYREVFSSGALLLALSQGLPVVAPGGGAGSELLSGEAGFRFDDDRLGEALAVAARAPLEPARAAALEVARASTWERAAYETINAYRGVAPRYVPRRRAAIS